MTKMKVYFPGLNGVRALAAFTVVVHHIEQFKYWEGIPSLWEWNFTKQLGNKAVGLFFVLSGFLITYLLIVEQKENKTIGVWKFYLRRILRVWPLYLTVLMIVFFFLPHVVHLNKFENTEHFFWNNFIMYLFFIPHLAIFMLPPVLGATQFWSVGIEENFYLVWPLILKLFYNNLWIVFGAIIMGKFFGEITLSILSQKGKLISVVFSFWKLFQIELLTIGSMGALVVKCHQDWFHIINNKYLQVAAYLTLFSLLLLPDNIVGLSFVQGLCSIIIILNIGTNPSSLIKLENGFYKLFGDISYGIYLWHVGVIALVGFYLKQFINIESLAFNILLYLLVFGLTIGLALLSFKKIELPFLRLKGRFNNSYNSKSQ